MIIWLIGLSGSGKTSVGKGLYNKLSKSEPFVFLDGDQVREMWGDNLGYEVEDREKNAIRISKLCKFLDQQNINVVAAVLSNFPKWQSWNRNNFTSYKEIFLDTPIELLKKRDSKKIYSRAKSGKLKNVVGIDIEFTPPKNYDLKIGLPEILKNPEEIASMIIKEINQ